MTSATGRSSQRATRLRARFNHDSRQLTGVGVGVGEGSGGMSLYTDGRVGFFISIPGDLLMIQPAWRDGALCLKCLVSRYLWSDLWGGEWNGVQIEGRSGKMFY